MLFTYPNEYYVGLQWELSLFPDITTANELEGDLNLNNIVHLVLSYRPLLQLLARLELPVSSTTTVKHIPPFDFGQRLLSSAHLIWRLRLRFPLLPRLACRGLWVYALRSRSSNSSPFPCTFRLLRCCLCLWSNVWILRLPTTLYIPCWVFRFSPSVSV